MTSDKKLLTGWGLGVVGVVVSLVGCFLAQALVGLAGTLLVAASALWLLRRPTASLGAEETPISTSAVAARPRRPLSDPTDTAGLVEDMLAQGRYALLLRPQVVSNMNDEQFHRAHEALTEHMAIVPEGDVQLGRSPDAIDDDEAGATALATSGRVLHVPGLFLDRFAVTNQQFQEFVNGGGYEQMSIWDPHIWPAVLDFVDSTGCPGPRFWKNGGFEAGEENQPVVGVSWYEAAAFARWVGKRLPSDAEWVKAGCWPVPLSRNSRIQRRYPWGDTMDRNRCNLWGSGPGRAVAVDEFSEGVSVGGVYQLIGNVWEWTSSNFGNDCGDMTLPAPMKSVRGGAFDTYFENQASCQFQSGEKPVARKHNIGFRCAVSLRDVTMKRDGERAADNAAAELADANVPHEVHA